MLKLIGNIKRIICDIIISKPLRTVEINCMPVLAEMSIKNIFVNLSQ